MFRRSLLLAVMLAMAVAQPAFAGGPGPDCTDHPPPVVQTDHYTVAYGPDVTLNVGAVDGLLANDWSPMGLPLGATHYASVTGPTYGSVVVHVDGSLTYTPSTSAAGGATDRFMYVADDGSGHECAKAYEWAYITVIGEEVPPPPPPPPVNNPPVAADDSYSVAEDGVLTVKAADGMLANDSDPDDDTLAIDDYTNATHGNVVVDTDGTLRYIPASNYHGPDSFTYVVSDGNGGTDTGQVGITVTSVNDAPVASFNWQGSVLRATFNAGGSSDIDGSVASYAWSFGDGQPGTGVSPSHAYGATGTYSVALTVTDNEGASSTVTQTVSVRAPQLSIADATMEEGRKGDNRAMSFTVSMVEASPVDVSVSYATTSGSAVASSDYVTSVGTVTIPAGQTSASMSVTVLGDNKPETDETFFVRLSGPSPGAVIVDGEATGTVINNR